MTPVTTSARGRAAMTAVPLVLVNGISVVAQYEFWKEHLIGWPPAGAAMLGIALESIAVYVGYHSFLAMMADRTSLRLRLTSYAIGAVIGMLNGSHYLAHGRITAASVGIGLLSASSPWLWNLHSRRQSQDTLIARGVLEPHALRIGTTRFVFHPLLSLRVMSAAAWTGTTDIREAIVLIQPQTQTARAALEWRPETLADMTTQADAIRFALAELARARNVDIDQVSPQNAADWLQSHADQLAESWQIPLSYIYDVQKRTLAARAKANGNGKVTQLSLTRGRNSA